jgi:hypothetical protein
MKNAHQNGDLRSEKSVPPDTKSVASEGGKVPEQGRVLKLGDLSGRANMSQPLKGAAGTGLSAPDAAVATIFVIAKKGTEFLDTPVFHAGESDETEAVALFTGRLDAQRYLDHAGWTQTDEVGELLPVDMHWWLTQASGEGIRYVVVNPDRERHLAGGPQPVLYLEDLAGKSPHDLFRQVSDLAGR